MRRIQIGVMIYWLLIIAFVGSILYPVLTGSILVTLPREREVTFSMEGDLVTANAAVEVTNGGFWAIEDLVVEVELTDVLDQPIAKGSNKLDDIPPGESRKLTIGLPMDLGKFEPKDLRDLLLNQTPMRWNANAEAAYAKGLISTELHLDQKFNWDPIVERMEIPSAPVEGEIRNGLVVFDIPYLFEFADWFTMPFSLFYRITNGTDELSSGKIELGSGGISSGVIEVELDQPGSKVLFTRSDDIELHWTLFVKEIIPVVSEERELDWDAPFHDLNIVSIQNLTSGLEISYRFSNRYSETVNGTVRAIIADTASSFKVNYTANFEVDPGFIFTHTLTIPFDWALVMGDELDIDLLWIDSRVDIEVSRTSVYEVSS